MLDLHLHSSDCREKHVKLTFPNLGDLISVEPLIILFVGNHHQTANIHKTTFILKNDLKTPSFPADFLLSELIMYVDTK